jgi:hypothetical protein
MDLKNLNEVPAFITKDGSEIRESLGHRNSRMRLFLTGASNACCESKLQQFCP